MSPAQTEPPWARGSASPRVGSRIGLGVLAALALSSCVVARPPCVPGACTSAGEVCGLDGRCGPLSVSGVDASRARPRLVRIVASRWVSSELPLGGAGLEVGGPAGRRSVLVFRLPPELAVRELASAVLHLTPARDAPLAPEQTLRLRSFPARSDSELLLRAGRNAPGPSVRRSVVPGRTEYVDVTRLIEARRSLLDHAAGGAEIAIALDTAAGPTPYRWASPAALDAARHPTLTLRID